MGDVFEYVYSLVLASAVAGVLSLVAPYGGKAVGKVIKYPVALAVILAVLAPLSGILSKTNDIDASRITEKLTASDLSFSEDRSTLDYVIERGRESAEEKLKSMLSSRFSLSGEDISVSLVLSEAYTLISSKKVQPAVLVAPDASVYSPKCSIETRTNLPVAPFASSVIACVSETPSSTDFLVSRVPIFEYSPSWVLAISKVTDFGA